MQNKYNEKKTTTCDAKQLHREKKQTKPNSCKVAGKITPQREKQLQRVD